MNRPTTHARDLSAALGVHNQQARDWLDGKTWPGDPVIAMAVLRHLAKHLHGGDLDEAAEALSERRGKRGKGGRA